MTEIFDISTKMFDIWTNMVKILTKVYDISTIVFKIEISVLEILTKVYIFFDDNLRYFEQNLCDSPESFKYGVSSSRFSRKTSTSIYVISSNIYLIYIYILYEF